MKLRMLILGAMAFALATPVLAADTGYRLSGDQSVQFPTDGTILHPGTVFGRAVINEDGASPVLVELSVINKWTDSVGGTTTSGIPGTTVAFTNTTTAGPTGGQTGSGSSATVITWGSLTGWSQTGHLFCQTNCPGGCPTGISSCVPFVGFEGAGPPAPLKSTTFDLGPQTFTAGDFTSAPLELVNLSSGAVTGWLGWGGAAVGPVPLLPLAAFGGLGAGMVFLGSRALRRKND